MWRLKMRVKRHNFFADCHQAVIFYRYSSSMKNSKLDSSQLHSQTAAHFSSLPDPYDANGVQLSKATLTTLCKELHHDN
jgi:hypothetical protein